jgi:hypothetical protein
MVMAMSFESYRFQRAFEARGEKEKGRSFYCFMIGPVHPSMRERREELMPDSVWQVLARAENGEPEDGADWLDGCKEEAYHSRNIFCVGRR